MLLLLREQRKVIAVRKARRRLAEHHSNLLIPALLEEESMKELLKEEGALTGSADPVAVPSVERGPSLNNRGPACVIHFQDREDEDVVVAASTRKRSSDLLPGKLGRQFPDGNIHRSEIDDVLYFAKYAEVVYTPKDIDMIDSGRLHFHSSENAIYRSPFLIVHDCESDSIVIAIRGTYSAVDALVDLKLDVVEFEIPGLEGGETHLAHEGFLQTARNICTEIEEANILGPMLNDTSSKFFGYSLVVTGHSLGAGVAALVAHILRSEFPSTHCYAYEPPGCVVSRQAAKFFEQFCTSTVFDDDVVPRMSPNSLTILKLDIARHLTFCDEPKWKVISSAIGDRVLCHNRRRGILSRRKKSKLLQQRTESGNFLPKDLAKLKRRSRSLYVGNNGKEYPFSPVAFPTPPMCIPGKILHIEKVRRRPAQDFGVNVRETPSPLRPNPNLLEIVVESPSKNTKYHYVPRWAREEEFQGIIVSRSMITDHSTMFPVFRELQAVPVEAILDVDSHIP
ncbi:hypothetical protein HDU98_000889 [Podochytrium sp. JEL0797]|nr:hypothetical protein HDU98_000889 [Podochytrium sp. JEL0797]